MLRLVFLGICLAAYGCGGGPAPSRDGGLDAATPLDTGASCTADGDCKDGFCDRLGRCQRIDEQTRIGTECSVPARVPQGFAISLLNTCGAYLCIEGRCRSCLEASECQIEYNAPSCKQVGTALGYRCGDYAQIPQTREPPARSDAGVVSSDDEQPLRLTASVVRTYPHDSKAYTEGLIYTDGELLEGTGIEGESQLRRVALESGEVLQAVDLPGDVFGEGIALHDKRIVQLSWKTERAFIWDAQTMAEQGEYKYSGEGWGLCHDGKQFVMSDGSSTLQLRDSETFELRDTIELDAAQSPFRNFGLNELECVGDEVYANIYEHRELARISLSQRKVTAWIDTRNLLSHPDVPQDKLSEVRDLNGIAHIPDSGHLLLTGKRWPRVFEVSLEPDQLFR